MERLKRKLDDYLLNWKNSEDKKPLIVKGARQIRKTNAIRNFGQNNYKTYIEINFIYNEEFKTIFQDGFNVNNIMKNITLKLPDIKLYEHDTLIFFDEMQECESCATALKVFNEDGRYDIICSGSLMGINYNKIESNSVGNKEDYIMYSMDFEEFLWAKGYNTEQIEDFYNCMKQLKPLSFTQYDVLLSAFRDYMITGGMPEIVSRYIKNKTYDGVLKMQKQILLDYEEDITKYAGGLDKGKILDCYRKIVEFLGKDNKKFQITKVSNGARSRDYIGVIDWLSNAGIVNISYGMEKPVLPIKANINHSNFRLYFADTGLLIASLEEGAQKDLRNNENFNTYKRAIYENIVADMLVKSGIETYFYRNETEKLEIDFITRDANSIVPIEVKASDNKATSLNNLINKEKYSDVKYGIKLCNKNIEFNGKFYTFPYFLTFLVKRFLNEK